MTLIAFDPNATIPGLLTGGVQTIDRALITSQGDAQTQAAKSIEALFAHRVALKRTALAEATSNPVTAALLREQSLLVSRKDRLTEAVSVISKAMTQIDYLKGHLDYLRDRITELEATTISAATMSTEWDNKMRKINELVADADVTFSAAGGLYFEHNLIQSTSRTGYGTHSLLAPYNAQGDSLEVTGVYLGTDHYVTDGDGEFWLSDNGFRINEDASATMAEYTSYPDTPTGTSTALSNMSLTDYTSDSSITFDTDTETGITGAITRGGLKLVDSWLYEDFGNQTAIDRAKDDLDFAESLLYLTHADFRNSKATLESRASVFDANILGISAEIAAELEDLRDDASAGLLATELEFAIAQFGFALLAARGNALISGFLLSQDAATAQDTTAYGEAILGAVVSVSA